jgi:hypothetical protein
MRLLLMIALAAPACAGVLFSDDFEDGDAEGWMEYPGGADYSVQGGWYVFAQSAPDQALAASLNGDDAGGMSVADCSLRAQADPDAGQFGLMIRFSIFYFHGYALMFIPEAGVAVIARIDGLASDPVPLAFTPVTIPAGEPSWMRFEAAGPLLGAKIWQGEVGDEPAEWLLIAEDGSYPLPGSIGLLALDADSGGTATIDVGFDDVEVTDDLTLDLSSCTWGRIKAGAGL